MNRCGASTVSHANACFCSHLQYPGMVELALQANPKTRVHLRVKTAEKVDTLGRPLGSLKLACSHFFRCYYTNTVLLRFIVLRLYGKAYTVTYRVIYGTVVFRLFIKP